MSKPAPKKRKTTGGQSLVTATIDDLTALTTAQLYSLSSRRHRDESLDNVRRAQEERDRAYLSLEQSQRWLERSSEHLERMEENAREAHKEYQDAKGLLARVRQASATAVEMMGGRAAASATAEDMSDDDDPLAALNLKKTNTSSKQRKVPFIQDVLIDLVQKGELTDGKKLVDATSEMIMRKDRTHFAATMKLVEELWTEEEELFLRSSKEEIAESQEELKVLTETIALRCLTKLNEWEGRVDPTPTTHQKPSYISLGTRARRIFNSRKKAEKEAEKADAAALKDEEEEEGSKVEGEAEV